MRFAWFLLPLAFLLTACGLVWEEALVYEGDFPSAQAGESALFVFPEPLVPKRSTFALSLRVQGSFFGGFLTLVPSPGEGCWPDTLGGVYGLICPGGEAPPGSVLLYLDGEEKGLDLSRLLEDLRGGFHPALWFPANARFGGSLRLEFRERGTTF